MTEDQKAACCGGPASGEAEACCAAEQEANEANKDVCRDKEHPDACC